MTSDPDLPAARTVAILVTYQPDLDVLDTLLDVFCTQVGGLVVVDNGSKARLVTALRGRLTPEQVSIPLRTVFQAGNGGLAQAQNVGIAVARSLGATHILLSDQDSIPAPGMVQTLQAVLIAKQRAGARPAAVGPRLIEPDRATRSPFFRLKAGIAIRPHDDQADRAPEIDSLIASGSLVPLAVFDDVGEFDESLFIDFVDTEWCFRARTAGYRCFGALDAGMSHHIGDRVLRLLRRNISVHTPLRNYYQTRNFLVLCRRNVTPGRWKLHMAPKVFLRSLILILCARPRALRARMIGLGLWHGYRGQLGRLDE